MIRVEDMKEIVAEAVHMGMNAHMRMLHPSSGMFTKAQAEDYLRRRGFKASVLSVWVNAKMVKPNQPGNKKNSPIYYDANEIDEAILGVKVFKANNPLLG